jgi:hypothetical protein
MEAERLPAVHGAPRLLAVGADGGHPGMTHPRRVAAAIDFSYNLGVGNPRASTLRREVNGSDETAVPGRAL